MSVSAAKPNGFDKLAKPYRWLEYLAFGPALARTRTAFLPRVVHAQHALVLGDGDGRFTAALLRRIPSVQVDAVDASASMLAELQHRVAQQGDAARVHALQADAVRDLPPGPYDLVCTHFFLDCLSDGECLQLARGVSARAEPTAAWLVSDFAVPQGSLALPARAVVAALYLAFRCLTGLRVSRLPNHAAALSSSGWACNARKFRLGGLLCAELWTRTMHGPAAGAGLPASKEHGIE